MKDLKVVRGIITNYKGEPVTTGEGMIQGSSECGFECCDGYLKLPGYNSVSGDSETVALYVVDGELVITDVTTAKAAIKAFKSNVLISATSVVISGCSEDDLVEDVDTLQLTRVVLPSGSSQAGTWTSSSPLVASVSVGGLVTALSVGTTTITFTSTDGAFTDTCLVTVVVA